jgi:hypothetical protein
MYLYNLLTLTVPTGLCDVIACELGSFFEVVGELYCGLTDRWRRASILGERVQTFTLKWPSALRRPFSGVALRCLVLVKICLLRFVDY